MKGNTKIEKKPMFIITVVQTVFFYHMSKEGVVRAYLDHLCIHITYRHLYDILRKHLLDSIQFFIENLLLLYF